MALTPQLTYLAQLIAQTLHLLHHRLAKRHISFAKVISGAILCVPLTLAIPATVYMSAHLTMVGVPAGREPLDPQTLAGVVMMAAVVGVALAVCVRVFGTATRFDQDRAFSVGS